MSTRTVAYLVVATAIFTLGAAWDHYGPWDGSAFAQTATGDRADGQDAAGGEDGGGQSVAAVTFGMENPVVATTPHKYATDMEEDPFNPDRVRRTQTTVTSIVLVRADGTVETKRVK
jgi:hypothetical protein